MNDASARNFILREHDKSGSYDNETLNELLNINELEMTEVLPPLYSNLTTNTHEMDIEAMKICRPCTRDAHLESNQPYKLKKLLSSIGKGTVSRKKTRVCSTLVIADAVKREISDAWKNAFVEVDECTLESNANVISLRIIYKVKTAEDS